MNFWLETKYPIAFDSPDHIMPHGTKNDNHNNIELFNEIEEHFKRKINFIDLGCSGGAFVKQFVDNGHTAIGLEGSDYSIIHNRAEWPELYRKNLFTCDIARKYQIYLYDSKEIYEAKFDIISCWEVIEHINPNMLEIFFNNIYNHLSDDGLFIGSISKKQEIINEVVLHQSIFDEDTWKKDKMKMFDVKEYCFKNKLRNDNDSFHFCASKYKDAL